MKNDFVKNNERSTLLNLCQTLPCVEAYIKQIVGKDPRAIDRLNRVKRMELQSVLKLRKMMMSTSFAQNREEVKTLEGFNRRMLDLSRRLIHTTSDMCREMARYTDGQGGQATGWMHFVYDGEQSVRCLANDSLYRSDFNYMIALNSRILETEPSLIPDLMTVKAVCDQMHPVELDDHEISQWSVPMICADPSMGGLNLGYMRRIIPCSVLSYLSANSPFSLPDLVRMDGFVGEVDAGKDRTVIRQAA